MKLKLSRELVHAISHEIRCDPEAEGILPIIPADLTAMPPEYELPLNREKVLCLDRAIKRNVRSGVGYFGTLSAPELLSQWYSAVGPFLDPL